MAGQIGMLSVLIDAQTAVFDRKIAEAAGNLSKKFDTGAKAATQAVTQFQNQFTTTATRIESSSAGIVNQFSRVQQAAIGLFSVAAAAQFARSLGATADGYANITAKLSLVTNGSKELAAAQADVYAISQRTYSTLDSTVTLATRTQRALVSNGADAVTALTKSLQLTETIQKAFAVSGATQQEASNAIVQLSQGLAAGALRGEEYNSVAEQGSRITQALAKNLNVTTGELRAMAKEGKLTAEIVVEALSSEGANIAAEFEKLPLTISRSFVLLDNAWTKYIGDADKAAGSSRFVAESIGLIGQNIEPIISGISTLAGAVALAFGGRALQGVGAYTQSLVQAAAAQSGLLEVERLAATAAVETARARSIEIAATIDAVAAARQDALATMALADAQVFVATRHLDAAKAAGVQSFALREQAIATEQLMAAQLRQRAVVNELAVLGAQQARLQAGLAEASTAQIAAQGRLAGALTTTQYIMQGLSKAGGALFTMIGGWPTIALAAAYGLYKLWEAMAAGDEQAAKSTQTLADYNKQVEERIRLDSISSGFGVSNQGAQGISGFQTAAADAAHLREEIASANDQITELSQRAREGSDGGVLALLQRIETLTDQLADAEAQTAKFSGEFSNLPPVLQGAITDVNELADSLARMFSLSDAAPVVAAISKLSDEAQKFIDKTRETKETLGLTAAQLTMYNAAQLAAKETTQANKDAIMQEAAALAQGQIALEAATAAKRSASKASKEFESDSEKLAKQIARLDDNIAGSVEKIGELGASFAQFADPMAEADAKLSESMDRLAQLEIAAGEAIDARAQKTKDYVEAANQHAIVEGQVALATQLATAAHALNVAEIERSRDITGLYVADLSAQIRLSGMSAQKSQVEATVMRALAEAKKLNVAAGKEVAKVDEQRIRQLAQLQQAMDAAASINTKSPLFEMADQAKEMGEAIKTAIEEGMDPELIKPMEEALKKLKSQVLSENIGSFKALLGAVQTFTKEGSSGFKNIEKGMAALSIIQDIIALKAAVTAVLTQGEGEPYSAFARMAAMAAAVAPFLASIGQTLASFGGSGSGGGSSGSASRQASQGTGSILGDADAKSESMLNSMEITANATSQLPALSRGMLDALQSMQAGISGASAGIARVEFGDLSLGQGMGMNSMLNPLGASGTIGGRLVSSIFGGEQDLIDQGIRIVGGTLNDMIANIMASAYQTVETNGGWFGSDEIDDEFQALSDRTTTQLRLVLQSISDAVSEGAEALGISGEDISAAIAAFRIEEIRISTMDLTGEEAQAELEAAFSMIFDDLAGSVVPFIEQFQQVGEGLGETLVRVATGVQVTQEAMRYLGITIDELDPEKFAQISEGLIGAVGGIDAFIEGMQNFANAFGNDAHRLQVATSELNDAFADAGFKSVPATREAMWALMQSLDATTEEGREQIATLLRLSSTAAQYYDLIEKAEKARLDYIIKASDLQTELGQGGGFAAGRAEIEAWLSDTIDTLNDLARAAGRSGAAEQDLVNAHSVAAQRVAQLIKQLKQQASDLAVQLGYITGTDTLDSLNAQIAAMGSASGEAADAIGSAVDAMREKMNLLLGDLSPFNDQRKLQIALEGLQAGTVDANQVLEIGRRLYASTSNYTDLFNQVMGMANFGSSGPATDTASGGEGDGRTLSELTAARDALLAAQRPELADQLAHRIAELSAATGDDFAAIAEEMGFGLEQIANDLSLSSEDLTALLEQYLDQFESADWIAVGDMISAAIDTSRDAIVAAIQGRPVDDIINAAENRASTLAEASAADRQALAERIDGTNERLDVLTSIMVSSGQANTSQIVAATGRVGQEIRDGRADQPRNIREFVR